MVQRARPLSPHLSVWRFTLTMTLSIVHRITGVALYAGMLLLVLWLAAAAWGPGPLASVNAVYAHPLGQLVLFGFTWALFHHMLGGLRYLFWDLGQGYERTIREGAALAHVVLAILLTLAVWAMLVWR